MNTAANSSGDALSGFALLKLNGPVANIQYINEDGTVFFAEQWTLA